MKAGNSLGFAISNVFCYWFENSVRFVNQSFKILWFTSCEIQQNWLNCLIHLKVLVTRSTKCKLNTAIEIHLTAAESNHSKKTFWSLICSNCRFITNSYLKDQGRFYSRNFLLGGQYLNHWRRRSVHFETFKVQICF